jgi:hypothetical protein
MHEHAATKNKSILIPMLVLTLCLVAGLVSFSSNLNIKVSSRLLYHHLIWPFGKLLVYLEVGLFIGLAIESLGWSARFGARMQPLVSWGRFGPESAAAGALLSAGALTVPQTVAALILGSIVATTVRALWQQLPIHAGIFAPKTGTELVMTSQGLSIISLMLVTIPYLWWT